MQTSASPDAWQEWAREFLAYGCTEEVGLRRYACFLAEQVRAGKAEHLTALKEVAQDIAWAIHRQGCPLFTSKHGSIAWGHGGQEEESWTKYSKKYHRAHGPARWKNGGVRLDSETRPTCIFVENLRGTIKALIHLDE